MAIPLPVEIAVQDAAGVRVALEAGAARVELCQALGIGGLTPSAGLIASAVELAAAASAPSFVHVLVRPRGGGFVYDDESWSSSCATSASFVHSAPPASSWVR